ncbi:hypothetical protein RGQ13_00555 [Thalassotalea psychrophila]|uniref:Transposase n=1 Tax=Thalassotalea psychrophila TaxID=3065647 RepID=A0ABY9TUG6_9GAMM|nr:hypothetical protein RGQ13_00555 [Colwelliaceae bacterium SQ149]
MKHTEWLIRCSKKIKHKFRKNRTPLSQALVYFFLDNDIEWTHAFTGTFKYSKKNKDAVTKELDRFTNELHSRCRMSKWKRRSKRFPKERLPMVSVVEGDGDLIHIHCHFLLAKPENIIISNDSFAKLIVDAWNKVPTTSCLFNDVKPLHNTLGWADYISKEVTTDDASAINWQFTHLFRKTTKK